MSDQVADAIRGGSATTDRSRSPSTWSSPSTVPAASTSVRPWGRGRLRDEPARPPGVRSDARRRRARTCSRPWGARRPCASPRWARATARSPCSCWARSPTSTWTTRRSTSAPAPAPRCDDRRRARRDRPDRPTARRRRQRAAGQPPVPPAARRSRDPRRPGGRSVRRGRDGVGRRPGAADGETIVPVGAFAFIDRLASTLDARVRVVDRLRRRRVLRRRHPRLPRAPRHRGRARRPRLDRHHRRRGLRSIARHAERCGLVASPSTTQHDALLALGFEAWLRGELERQTALLDEREGLEAVRTWGGRSRATLLIDPAALGRIRWLLLASPGLPPRGGSTPRSLGSPYQTREGRSALSGRRRRRRRRSSRGSR